MWALSPKIAKITDFWYKFTPKGYIPLSNFYEIWCGGGSPRSTPSRQISPLWLYKCGLTAPKIAKMVIFGINLPRKGISPQAIFTKFRMGRESQAPPLCEISRLSLLKCGLIALKIAKTGNFGINLPERGMPP